MNKYENALLKLIENADQPQPPPKRPGVSSPDAGDLAGERAAALGASSAPTSKGPVTGPDHEEGANVPLYDFHTGEPKAGGWTQTEIADMKRSDKKLNAAENRWDKDNPRRKGQKDKSIENDLGNPFKRVPKEIGGMKLPQSKEYRIPHPSAEAEQLRRNREKGPTRPGGRTGMESSLDKMRYGQEIIKEHPDGLNEKEWDDLMRMKEAQDSELLPTPHHKEWDRETPKSREGLLGDKEPDIETLPSHRPPKFPNIQNALMEPHYTAFKKAEESEWVKGMRSGKLDPQEQGEHPIYPFEPADIAEGGSTAEHEGTRAMTREPNYKKPWDEGASPEVPGRHAKRHSNPLYEQPEEHGIHNSLMKQGAYGAMHVSDAAVHMEKPMEQRNQEFNDYTVGLSNGQQYTMQDHVNHYNHGMEGLGTYKEHTLPDGVKHPQSTRVKRDAVPYFPSDQKFSFQEAIPHVLAMHRARFGTEFSPSEWATGKHAEPPERVMAENHIYGEPHPPPLKMEQNHRKHYQHKLTDIENNERTSGEQFGIDPQARMSMSLPLHRSPLTMDAQREERFNKDRNQGDAQHEGLYMAFKRPGTPEQRAKREAEVAKTREAARKVSRMGLQGHLRDSNSPLIGRIPPGIQNSLLKLMKGDDIPDDMASYLRYGGKGGMPKLDYDTADAVQDAEAHVRSIQPKQPKIPSETNREKLKQLRGRAPSDTMAQDPSRQKRGVGPYELSMKDDPSVEKIWPFKRKPKPDYGVTEEDEAKWQELHEEASKPAKDPTFKTQALLNKPDEGGTTATHPDVIAGDKRPWERIKRHEGTTGKFPTEFEEFKSPELPGRSAYTHRVDSDYGHQIRNSLEKSLLKLMKAGAPSPSFEEHQKEGVGGNKSPLVPEGQRMFKPKTALQEFQKPIPFRHTDDAKRPLQASVEESLLKLMNSDLPAQRRAIEKVPSQAAQAGVQRTKDSTANTAASMREIGSKVEQPGQDQASRETQQIGADVIGQTVWTLGSGSGMQPGQGRPPFVVPQNGASNQEAAAPQASAGSGSPTGDVNPSTKPPTTAGQMASRIKTATTQPPPQPGSGEPGAGAPVTPPTYGRGNTNLPPNAWTPNTQSRR